MKNTASFSRFSAAVGLILGAAATVIFAQTDYSLIQKYRVLEPTVAKAQKYLDQGQVDRCTAEINRCFETVPDHHGARYIRGPGPLQTDGLRRRVGSHGPGPRRLTAD